MAKPTYYPDWATDNTVLPSTGQTNKVRPKTSLRTTGWDKGEMPTAEEWNWELNNVSLWVRYLSDEVVDNLPNVYLPKTGTTLTFEGDISGTANWTGASTTNVTLSSATLNAATSAATPDTLVKRSSTGGANFTALVSTTLNASGQITGTAGATITGATSVAAITTSSSQGSGINALTRKDYVDGIQTTLQNNINNLASTAAATYVQGIRLGTEYSKIITKDIDVKAEAGGVANGWHYEGDNPGGDTIFFRPVQYNINNTWYTAGQI